MADVLPGIPESQFVPDALLTAPDLRATGAREDQLRALHVALTHRTWGVAVGLQVELGKDGETVLVAPGLAYDVSGREVLALEPMTVRLPAGDAADPNPSWWADLALAPGVPTAAEQKTGAPPVHCRWVFAGPAGPATAPAVPPSAAVPVAAGIRLGVEIPLARLRVGLAGTRFPPQEIDLTVRRATQPLARPHVAGDVVPAGLPVLGRMTSWSMQVDTSAAAFELTPVYLVSTVDDPIPGVPPAGVDRSTLIGPLLSISSPSPTGFTLTARLATAGDRVSSALSGPQQLSPFAVSWLGVEPSIDRGGTS